YVATTPDRKPLYTCCGMAVFFDYQLDRAPGRSFRTTRLAAMTQTSPIAGDTKREYAPSGAQKPPANHLVPASSTSTSAEMPSAKPEFVIACARHKPNVPAMMNIARGNELSTIDAHRNSLNADTSAESPDPATDASAPVIATISSAIAPNAV